MNNQAAPSPDATVQQAINNVAKMTASANTAVANMANKAVAVAPQMGGRRRRNNMARKSRRNNMRKNNMSRKNRKNRKNTRRNRRH